MNAIVEDRIFIHLADPCKAGAVEVFFDFLHLHFGVAFLEISDPEASEPQKCGLLIWCEFRDQDSLIRDNGIVMKSFGIGVGSVFFTFENRFLFLFFVQATD